MSPNVLWRSTNSTEEALFNTSIKMELTSEELEIDIVANNSEGSMESSEQVSGNVQGVPLSRILYSKSDLVQNNEIV